MKEVLINSIFLPLASEAEVSKIISSLKNKSAGYDGIDASILKLSCSHSVAPLTYICYLSIQNGVFPRKMKTAYVIPLYKGDNVTKFNNYHHVSVLPTVSKVFEKIMYMFI
jgi:hypothetical protein